MDESKIKELEEAEKTIELLRLQLGLMKHQNEQKDEKIAELTYKLEKHTKGAKAATMHHEKNLGAWSDTGEPDPELNILLRTIAFGHLTEKEGLSYKDAIKRVAEDYEVSEMTLRSNYPKKPHPTKKPYPQQYREALADFEARFGYSANSD